MSSHQENEANTTVYIFASPLQQILATILQDVQTVMTWGIFQQISVSIVALIWFKP